MKDDPFYYDYSYRQNSRVDDFEEDYYEDYYYDYGESPHRSKVYKEDGPDENLIIPPKKRKVSNSPSSGLSLVLT